MEDRRKIHPHEVDLWFESDGGTEKRRPGPCSPPRRRFLPAIDAESTLPRAAQSRRREAANISPLEACLESHSPCSKWTSQENTRIFSAILHGWGPSLAYLSAKTISQSGSFSCNFSGGED